MACGPGGQGDEGFASDALHPLSTLVPCDHDKAMGQLLAKRWSMHKCFIIFKVLASMPSLEMRVSGVDSFLMCATPSAKGAPAVREAAFKDGEP